MRMTSWFSTLPRPPKVLAALVVATVVFAPPARSEDRVAEARAQRETTLKALFAEEGVAYPPRALLLRAFKSEGEVELWAGDDAKEPLTLLRTYPICHKSGKLGPKRAQGDLQVPEGFYHVDRYNPKSSYHLSLGVNYPNAADKKRSDRAGIKRRGGDIFIHGDCVTIGCIPLTDALIEEVYLVAWDAKRIHGAKTHVYILPFRFSEENFTSAKDAGYDNEISLWRELESVNARFERKNVLPRVRIDKKGRYR